MNMREAIAIVAAAGLLAASNAEAQAPADELDRNWINVCPGAVPGTPFYDRCQEILNAGPGSGGRRSAAASGNNLETVSAQGRAGSARAEEPRFELSEGRFNFFASLQSGFQERPASDTERAYDASLQTVLVGVDYLATATMTTGIGFSYHTSGLDFEAGAGDLRKDRIGALGFWNWSPGRAMSLESYVGYDRLKHDVERSIAYLITLNQGLPTQESRQVLDVARANVAGHQLQAGGALAGDLRVRSLTLAPRAAIEYCGTTLEPYAESDGVGLAMAYDEQRFHSLVSRAGVFASTGLSRAWGVLSPQLRAEHVHEHASDEREIRTRFVQDSNGYRIALRTEAPDRDFWMLGLGAVAVLPGGFSAFLDFQRMLGHDQMDEQILSAGLRARL